MCLLPDCTDHAFPLILFIFLFTQFTTQDKHKTDNMKNTKARADHRVELQLQDPKSFTVTTLSWAHGQGLGLLAPNKL